MRGGGRRREEEGGVCAVSHLVTQTVARRRRRRGGRCRVCLYPGGPAARQPASLALLATVPGLAVSCWSSAVTCGASMAASPPTQHRDNTAVWLLQVCSQEQASPHIFCLAVNMMDRVLSRVEVSPPQLPLLASACLLVSWKIRQHKPIPASSIVKHSQAAFLQEELLVRPRYTPTF